MKRFTVFEVGEDHTSSGHKRHDVFTEARLDFHDRIGKHIINDDAKPRSFYITMTSDLDESPVITDKYEFSGFAPPVVHREPGPMTCPQCGEEVDLEEDVEQWSDAVNVYSWVESDERFTQQERQMFDEHGLADHRVYCRLCGETTPLDEWMEAYENR